MDDTERKTETETGRAGERGRLSEETKMEKLRSFSWQLRGKKDELVGGQQKSFVGVPLMRSTTKTKTTTTVCRLFFIGFTVT